MCPVRIEYENDLVVLNGTGIVDVLHPEEPSTTLRRISYLDDEKIVLIQGPGDSEVSYYLSPVLAPVCLQIPVEEKENVFGSVTVPYDLTISMT